MSAPLYLDHNAASPLRDEARAVLVGILDRGAANPSSLHRDGQAARAELERARGRVAAALGGRPGEWFFTSGATESCNLALWGACAGGRPLLFGATEHPAVAETAAALAPGGPAAQALPVRADGRLDLDALKAALGPRPGAVVAVMAANNETGVVHPVAEAAALARDAGGLLFCDLAQAAGKRAVDVEALGVDLAAASAPKFGGPPGVGLLYVRGGLALRPLLRGGHQEGGRRPGTENVAGAGAAAAALEAAVRGLDAQVRAWTAAVGALEEGLRRLVPGLAVHGAGAERVANTLCVGLPGVDRDLFLMRLDQLGLRASAGAACAAGAAQPSAVLRAMGVPAALARGQVRFSFGPGQGPDEASDALARVARAL